MNVSQSAQFPARSHEWKAFSAFSYALMTSAIRQERGGELQVGMDRDELEGQTDRQVDMVTGQSTSDV